MSRGKVKMSTGRQKDYALLSFVVLVIILLVVMQQCERQEVTIFESPIMRLIINLAMLVDWVEWNAE